MPCWLHLILESLAGNDDPEVGFLRGRACHGFVMGVQVRIIVNLEGRGFEGFDDLFLHGLLTSM